MAKIKNDYFKMMEDQTSDCVRAAQLLETIINNYSSSDISEKKEEMHLIEQVADDRYHDILSRLSSEFITPIDQEDILRLVQIIDDVTDAIDEAVLELYMFRIEKIPGDAALLADLVNKCVKSLFMAVGELKRFKKPLKLREYLVEVNAVESEADEAFANAIYRLFESESDCKILIGSKAVYECLENCCDLCEHAANVIEQIIVKNT